MKATILVVEDDVHLMEGIRDILEINDYEVLTATHGKAGLEVLERQPAPPDLIVSDIMMPYMNGYEFFEAVRAKNTWITIPFIFLTAKGERDDIHRGKRMGAEDYVVKPFSADDLLVAVSAKLDRKRQLEEAAQGGIAEIKRNILTILNHEMRTPLTYVVAYADMLSRDGPDLGLDDMRNFLRGINAGANRLRHLVESFILLVELETGEAANIFEVRKQPMMDFKAVLQSVCQKYTDIAEENGLQLEIDAPDELPPVMVDHEYLSAAIECLVDNAIKFTEQPGKAVTVRVAPTDDQGVEIVVSDEGRGIPAHEMEHIFESFYQIDRQRFEDQGAGSGLAIVKAVVRLHQGSMDVTSTPSEGSTFTIRLPAASEDD
ncbi:MAG: hybrid sensor histidine kinase/response regulator [Chloroflexi bacterium]|nr:hybrid sensor histidine kinase/response regulator [Chloroflexota bacterium]